MENPIKNYGFIFTIGLVSIIIVVFIFLSNNIPPSIAQSNSKGNMGQTKLPKNFNHDATAFPLLGAHKKLECSKCHLGGKFTGLPTTCENCHNNQIVYGKSQQHLNTSQNCDLCHMETAWTPATFRHDLGMVVGQCSNCHNGQKATGKTQNHIVTTAQCDTCHSTTAWTGAKFIHDLATVSGQCSNCHNGREATGKPQNHIVTTAQCDTCHSTTAWTGAKFIHDLATVSGQCSNCHNGREATGKPQNHIVTTAQCDTCHTTTTWVGGQFKHELTVVMGQCSNCHNGRQATGKPQNHIVTTAQCDTCHRTTGWIPANFATHDNPKLIGAHSQLDCKACHTQSIPAVFYTDGTRYGFCANCHTRDYTFPGPGAHKKNPLTKVQFSSLDEALRFNAMCANCHKHASYRKF